MATPPCMGNSPHMGNNGPPYMGNNAPMFYQPRRRNNNPTLFYAIIAVAVYTFIVYIFQITPSTLFNSRFFMLFVIFTILFILTADFRAFSSPQQHNNNQFHHNGQHARYCQTCTAPSSSYVTKYEQVAIENCITSYPNDQVATNDHEEANERVIEMAALQNDATKEHDERIKQSNNKRRALSEVDNNRIKALSCEEKHIIPTTIYGRSKSCNVDKVESVVIKDDGTKKNMKNGTKKVQVAKGEEENEFANMTNEELNRRVDEFIHKFNRQIRASGNC